MRIWALIVNWCLQHWYGCTLSFSLDSGDNSTAGYGYKSVFMSHLCSSNSILPCMKNKQIIISFSKYSPRQCIEQQEKSRMLSNYSVKEYWSPMAGLVSILWKTQSVDVMHYSTIYEYMCVYIDIKICKKT